MFARGQRGEETCVEQTWCGLAPKADSGAFISDVAEVPQADLKATEGDYNSLVFRLGCLRTYSASGITPVSHCFFGAKGTIMLRKVSGDIKDCLDRAAEARNRAEETIDPAQKAELLRSELRWIRLARHFEFAESLDRS